MTLARSRPNFRNPPVVEQAFVVLFDTIPGFSIGEIGLFWNSIGNRFPHCESKPRLSPVFEDIGGETTFHFAFGDELSVPRALFRSADGSELLQVQSDRFAFNWMRSEDHEYPRHEETMGRFFALFEEFQSFLDSRKLSRPVLKQCELINVNFAGSVEFPDGLNFGRVFGIYNEPDIDKECLLSEGMTIRQDFLMRSKEYGTFGRLHFEANMVKNIQTQADGIRFDLSARGKISPIDIANCEKFFTEARSFINHAFMRVTSDEARKIWGEE